MTEERTLVANLVPQVSDAELKKLLESIQSELNLTVTVTTPETTAPQEGVPTAVTPTTTATVIEEALSEPMDDIEDIVTDTQEQLDETFEVLDEDLIDAITDDGDKEDSVLAKGFGMVREGLDIGIGFSKMMLGIWNNFWGYLKKASPFLGNIMSKFSSAMDFILGPIGTAFGVKLVPLLESLYENVFEVVQMMWDAYEEEGITGMIRVAMENAIPVFLEVARTAFEMIPDDIPVISSIRDGIVYVMNWVVEHRDVLANILDIVIRVGNFIMRHLAIVVSLIAGFTTAYFASKFFDKIPIIGGMMSAGTGGVVMGALAGGATLAGLSYIDSRRSEGFASGGFIPSTPGGRLINVSEGGEGEYIVPESQRESFANQYSTSESRSLTFNFYGYNEDQLVDKVRDIISDDTHLSALRSGF